MTTPFTLHLGDCLNTLRGMPDNSIDAIVTDPPYGLGKEPDALAMLQDWLAEGHHDVKGRGFMGKEWDAFVPQPVLWRECLRVLKPGGHLLAFGGSRTFDLVCLGLRIAGFEMRDTLMWVYGQGFPKSLDVSKAIDAAAGAEREVVGYKRQGPKSMFDGGSQRPTSLPAKHWSGFGTALKPAHEPICLARKPLGDVLNSELWPILGIDYWSTSDDVVAGNPGLRVVCQSPLREGLPFRKMTYNTETGAVVKVEELRPYRPWSTNAVAANVLRWGTGALNIDGCRIKTGEVTGWGGVGSCVFSGGLDKNQEARPTDGRWPANLCHDGSDEVVGLFPNSTAGSDTGLRGIGGIWSPSSGIPCGIQHGETGSAARFFYCAKASKADRNEGLEAMPVRSAAERVNRTEGSDGMGSPRAGAGRTSGASNHHATVKPTALMRWLVRLVTPPGGVVLDPFTGSGSTGKAAILEGFRFIGCEMEAEYIAIAEARCKHAAMSIGEPIEDEPTPGGTEQQGNLLSLMDI